MKKDESFAKRWSDRKQADDLDADEVLDAAPEAPEETVDPEKTDAEILEELGLKDPDDMVEGDDFSAFMSSAVPTRLRNRALRKLWIGNPILANVDGLVDYGEDFTDAATVIENMQTIYQVGKGMVQKVTEALDEIAGPEDDLDTDSEIGDETEPDEQISEAEEGDEIEEIRGDDTVEIPLEEPMQISREYPDIPAKKRMRFSFPDAS